MGLRTPKTPGSPKAGEVIAAIPIGRSRGDAVRKAVCIRRNFISEDQTIAANPIAQIALRIAGIVSLNENPGMGTSAMDGDAGTIVIRACPI
jgi:hypothetical protein